MRLFPKNLKVGDNVTVNVVDSHNDRIQLWNVEKVAPTFASMRLWLVYDRQDDSVTFFHRPAGGYDSSDDPLRGGRLEDPSWLIHDLVIGAFAGIKVHDDAPVV